MISKIRLGVLVILMCSVIYNGSALAARQLIDLGKWSVVQYELNNQSDANWTLMENNTVAKQSVNADASILLSDFDIRYRNIQGTWQISGDDDDFVGFVFGYQDRGHYYLFDWKQRNQEHNQDIALKGMSLKIVNIPNGNDPVENDLWSTEGSPNVTILRHNLISWKPNREYSFRLNFRPGQFDIEVSEGDTVLENWSFTDNTYKDGNFGFYNYSQENVLYSGFTVAPATFRQKQTNWLESVMDTTTIIATFALLSFMVERLTNGIALVLGYWKWWRVRMEVSTMSDRVKQYKIDRNRRVALFALGTVLAVPGAIFLKLDILTGLGVTNLSPSAGQFLTGLLTASGADPLRELLNKRGLKDKESAPATQPIQVTGTLVMQQSTSTQNFEDDPR